MTPTTEDETPPSPATDRSMASGTGAAASRLARLQALRSAWGVLAPSALSEDGQRIAGIGRNLTARIDALGQDRSVSPDQEGQDIDRELEAFETSIRTIAARVPVSQFRSTLPGHLPGNRQGLLDLLDILIGPGIEELEPGPCHPGAIDYLITLLCIHSGSPLSPGGAIRHDPVTLTPRLESLSLRAEEIAGERFTGVEAEFFIAAGMDGRDLREEFQHRTLRSRKAELGLAFFVPRILRAIVTYNAALISRAADEAQHSGDWGFAGEEDPGDDAPGTGTGRISVFDSEPLRQIIDSVRRRARGEAPRTTASDQIAWALDFDHLTKSERKALLTDRPGSRQEPLGTAIVVGLICRSLAVLSVELQTLGIPPDDLADLWTDELGRLFQEEINRHISRNDYRTACSLSEIKNKFVSAPLADQFREQGLAARPAAVPPTPETGIQTDPMPATPPREEKRESARDLIRSALDESIEEHSGAGTRIGGSAWPWLRIGQAAALIALVAVMVGAGLGRPDRDLETWNREQLATVSPHLLHGARSDEGRGTAFVGTIDEAWLDLPPRERGESAEDLVMRLRNLGLRQIMIYDEDDVLRIQAIGSQPIRML